MKYHIRNNLIKDEFILNPEEEEIMIKKSYSWVDAAPSTIATLLFFLQIIIGIYLLSDVSQNQLLAYTGIGLYCFSGLVFGMLPVFEFRKKGGVLQGKSYIHTTKLVDSGIYSIVRHPQYVTFILWAIAGMLLFQHWIVICLGIPVIPLMYIDLIHADREGIKKFGEEYKTYMKKVPRANFLLGSIRMLQRKRNSKSI
jgi:protein-S-isoprenylcysteine O-methyltransferase Ste14